VRQALRHHAHFIAWWEYPNPTSLLPKERGHTM